MILAFVGVKMLLVGEPFEVHLPTYLSLVVIAVVLTVAIVASLRADAREHDGDDTHRPRARPTATGGGRPPRTVVATPLNCGRRAARSKVTSGP